MEIKINRLEIGIGYGFPFLYWVAMPSGGGYWAEWNGMHSAWGGQPFECGRGECGNWELRWRHLYVSYTSKRVALARKAEWEAGRAEREAEREARWAREDAELAQEAAH